MSPGSQRNLKEVKTDSQMMRAETPRSGNDGEEDEGRGQKEERAEEEVSLAGWGLIEWQCSSPPSGLWSWSAARCKTALISAINIPVIPAK